MLLSGTENLNQFLSPSCGIVCLIRMLSVKSFCHTSSAQMEKFQRGRGLSYFSGFFSSPTGIFMVQSQGKSQHYVEYLQVLALECLYLRQTDHLIWMSPALQEKLSLLFIPGLLRCNHLLFWSFSVFNIQHFNGWMQGAILLKNMHWYFVGICFANLFCQFVFMQDTWTVD